MGVTTCLDSEGNEDVSAVKITSSRKDPAPQNLTASEHYYVTTTCTTLGQWKIYRFEQVVRRADDRTIVGRYKWIEIESVPPEDMPAPKISVQEVSYEDLLDSDGNLTNTPIEVPGFAPPPVDGLTRQPRRSTRKRFLDREQRPPTRAQERRSSKRIRTQNDSSV